MCDLGFALFLTLIAAGVGRRLLSGLGQLPEHPLDRLALSAPLGLGGLALATLAIGELGWMNLLGLALLLGIATEIGLLSGLRLGRDLAVSLKSELATAAPSFTGRSMAVLLALTLVGTALTTLLPVTDGDALCYHLQVPKVFLVRGAVFFDPDLHETVYPLVTEMLYALALEFRGPVACRWVQWVLGLMFAANVTALARPSLGRRAWWAGLIALLVPAVTNGMTAPLNDVALAAFGTAAMVAWARLLDRPTVARAVTAGGFAGLAVGVKYPALVLCALLWVTVALRPLLDRACRSRETWSRSIHLAFVFLAAVIVTGGTWYLRAYLHTGNPVFPFFRAWFGGAGLDEVLDPIKRPLAVNIWNLLTAIIPMTLQPERFDSFAHQFGPVFLLFLPALVLERAPRRVLGIAGLGYLFLMLCMTQRQSMRFLLIAVGPMSVGVAYLADRWSIRKTIPARILLTTLLLVLGFESALAAGRARRTLDLFLRQESADQFLARCEPTFRVGRWVASHLPATARLIGQDHRGFYIPRDYTMELAHRRRTGLGRSGESSRAVIEELRRSGFTHLMLCPPVPEDAVEFDPTLGRVLSPWLADRAPIYREELADADGVVRRYAIYELSGEILSTAAARSLTQ